MRKLVATATAAASASGVSCSHTDDVKTVTITMPPTPSASAIEVVHLPPTASATLMPPTPPPPPPPDPSGYLVVDMLPAPARCIGVAAGAMVTGKFVHDASGIVLDIVVTLNPSTATFAGAPSAWSARIVSSSFRSHSTVGVARVSPQPPSATTMSVTFPVTCGGPGSLGVNISWTGAAVIGASPTMSLYDF